MLRDDWWVSFSVCVCWGSCAKVCVLGQLCKSVCVGAGVCVIASQMIVGKMGHTHKFI